MRVRRRGALGLFGAVLAAACTTDMNVTVNRTTAADRVVAAGPHCEPERTSVSEASERSCVLIGDAFVGDTGRSWRCSRRRVEDDLASVACSLGANAMVLQPVLGAGCYQARASFFTCPEPTS